jgi:hypothetical protein
MGTERGDSSRPAFCLSLRDFRASSKSLSNQRAFPDWHGSLPGRPAALAKVPPYLQAGKADT